MSLQVHRPVMMGIVKIEMDAVRAVRLKSISCVIISLQIAYCSIWRWMFLEWLKVRVRIRLS